MKFECVNRPFTTVIGEFLKAFVAESQDRKIEIQVRQFGNIPEELCVDWRLYKSVLFQLVSNSLNSSKKSEKPEQQILIDLAYIRVERASTLKKDKLTT